jgi:The GLUG motif
MKLSNPILSLAFSSLFLLSGCGKYVTSGGINLGSAGNTGGSQGSSTLVQGSTCAISSAFSGGDGSSSHPYVIGNLCDFINLNVAGSTWGSHFSLDADLDFTGISFLSSIAFSGNFEGNHHSILNYSGLTPLIQTNSGTIQNLFMTSIHITLDGNSRVAGMVGTNATGGTLTNCGVSGLINTSVFNGYFNGGLVGENAGTISHSYANVAITGLAVVGGLVGLNNGTITTSYSLGTVVATGSAAGMGVGGLVGVNNTGASITNSYAKGSVQGQIEVGGLVGSNLGVVTDAFSTGSVAATGTLGGLVGANSGSVVSSYWDTTASGVATSPAGTGETTAQMETQATFTSWDFSGVWNLPGASYPVLR